jgi:hypothetical protein
MINLPLSQREGGRQVIIIATTTTTTAACLFSIVAGAGQASDPIPPLSEFAESCVFGKQSPGPTLCGSILQLPTVSSAPSPEVTGQVCKVP